MKHNKHNTAFSWYKKKIQNENEFFFNYYYRTL